MAQEAVDPDIEATPPIATRPALQWRVLVAVSLGGGIGALARYGIETVLPAHGGRFPVGTFVINVTGCALIGVLMVLVTDVFPDRPLLRPFAGVGVLGGYTTFSTYTNEIHTLLLPGRVPLAFAYLFGTLAAALLATFAAIAVTRAIVARGQA